MFIGEKRKRVVSLLLILSLVALSGNLMAQAWQSNQERKGAELKIQKNDGQKVLGELIAVERDSLLLLSEEIEADISEKIQIKDVKVITIVTKSRVLQVGIYGVLVGILYGSINQNPYRYEDHSQKYFTFGAIGGAAGAALGTVLGMNKRIQIQGKSDTEIQESLLNSAKKLKFPEYNEFP